MTAVSFANRFASLVSETAGVAQYPSFRYGPRVRNKREAAEHGWMPAALATVTFEDSGVDLIDLLARMPEDGEFYLEAYSTYMVGVYRR